MPNTVCPQIREAPCKASSPKMGLGYDRDLLCWSFPSQPWSVPCSTFLFHCPVNPLPLHDLVQNVPAHLQHPMPAQIPPCMHSQWTELSRERGRERCGTLWKKTEFCILWESCGKEILGYSWNKIHRIWKAISLYHALTPWKMSLPQGFLHISFGPWTCWSSPCM